MIRFSSPLVKGKLISRYKRFLADIELENGNTVTAHCPNTGSMKSCGEKGDTVFLTHNNSPKRKLAYTWEFTQTTQGLIGINTGRPNQIIETALRSRQIPELSQYDIVKKEIKVSDRSRLDFFCQDSDQMEPNCLIEVKNVTLLENETLLFPDAISQRGLKHLQELSQLAQQGNRAIIFFFINRPEGKRFEIARAIDLKYYQGFSDALKAGVEPLVYRALPSMEGIAVGSTVPLVHPGYSNDRTASNILINH